MKHTRKNKGTLFLILIISSGFIFSSDVEIKKNGHSRLFHDQTFHYEALRVLQYATDGGADINEVLYTLGKIKQGDNEAWHKEWFSTAQRIEQHANSIKYDKTSKGLAYGRAHNYYRAAEFFMLATDKRKEATSNKIYETFYKSLDILEVEYEMLEIPYENKKLQAIFYKGQDGAKQKPLIVIICGYDSIKEEMYYMFVKAAIERGYAIICYDGPGQGVSIRQRNLLMTHEWEKPNSAVLDYFIENQYNPKKIVLLGNSLGGILATRAAAFDARIDGIINYDIFYDFAEAALYHSPDNFKETILSGGEINNFTKTIMEKMLKYDPHFNWAMTQGGWVFGMDRNKPWEILENYTHYSIKDIAHQVHCDVLLLAGEKDHFVPIEFMEINKKALTQAKTVTTFIYDEASGGHEHCQAGANFRWRGDVFEWLAEHYPY